MSKVLPLPAFTATVTAKGPITLRKELLRHLRIGPGEAVERSVGRRGFSVETAVSVWFDTAGQ